MRIGTRSFCAVLAAAVTLLVVPEAAYGYGGPGSIVSGIGALLAAVVAIGAAIVGFFWFPLKRLMQRVRSRPEDEEGEVVEAS